MNHECGAKVFRDIGHTRIIYGIPPCGNSGKLVMLFEDTWVRSFKYVSVLGVAILHWVSVGRFPVYRVSRFEM